MKVEARVLDVQSTLSGERVGMTIDHGALAHIMSVLTDLYSDPELAVIREYSTNALDSHVEASVTRPIEVQLPTSLSPFLKVRDFGIGLDAEGIREIYSRYGASTKRGSNDVVGMLGLGCKSALTYTDQFTLSGIKDGICTQVSISRDEDGSGSMTIVAEYETDAENGVEVIVPAKRGNQFESKARDFFRFWKDGDVLLNGEEPKKIDGLWIADDLLLTTEIDDDLVVMGNVAYPIDDGVIPHRSAQSYSYRHNYSRQRLVAFVDIGSVAFTPSREALQQTSNTKATLTKLAERYTAEKQIALQKLIDDSTDHASALAMYHKAVGLGFQGSAAWKGQDIPSKFQPVDDAPHFVSVAKPRYRAKGWSEASVIPSTFVKARWITGYESLAFTPYKRAKLDQWAEKNGIDHGPEETFILCKTLPAPEWIPKDRVHKWADIEAEKIVRENSVKRIDGRLSGSYDVYEGGQTKVGVPANDIDTSKAIYFAHGNYWQGRSNYDWKVISNSEKDAILVCLPANRIEKFKRDFPMAKDVKIRAGEIRAAWLKTVSQEDKLAFVVQSSRQTDGLKQLDEKEINDPALSKAVKLARKNINGVKTKAAEYDVNLSDGIKFDDPTDKYPLLTNPYGYAYANKQHVYLYVNAAYAARKEV